QADVGIAMGGGTDIAVESADVVIVRDDLRAILTAQQLSRSSYRRTRQNVALAFLFNGTGILVATTGLVYPVWAMVAMALSVTTIFVNSLGGRPSLPFDAIVSDGRPSDRSAEPTCGAHALKPTTHLGVAVPTDCATLTGLGKTSCERAQVQIRLRVG